MSDTYKEGDWVTVLEDYGNGHNRNVGEAYQVVQDDFVSEGNIRLANREGIRDTKGAIRLKSVRPATSKEIIAAGGTPETKYLSYDIY